jgi:hypothetical protein
MLTMLTAPEQTLALLGVVIGLGAACVWLFWEIEQVTRPQRKGAPTGTRGTRKPGFE